jgi:hypothetical protein
MKEIKSLSEKIVIDVFGNGDQYLAKQVLWTKYDVLVKRIVETIKQALAAQGNVSEPRYGHDGRFKIYGTTDCKNADTGKHCGGRVSLYIANEECTNCNPESYEKAPPPSAPSEEEFSIEFGKWVKNNPNPSAWGVATWVWNRCRVNARPERKFPEEK